MDVHHFFQFPVTNAIWVAVLGKKFEEGDPALPELVEMSNKCLEITGAITSQISWSFPWIANLLNFVGLNQAATRHNKIYDYIYSQVKQCREDHVSEQPKHFTHAYFDQVDQTQDPQSTFYQGTHERISTGDIFMAASDTTTLTLDWFLLYMAREPHVQRKLQAEIDSILGTKENAKIASLSDVPSMPYTAAVIHEVLRIRPIAPMGFFHRVMKDVDFHGYQIPKNTMILSNLYRMQNDPLYWENPDTFNPERFLDSNGKLNKASSDILTFSSGKRSCIGEGFARDQLFLISTSFFQQFSVSCTDHVPSVEGKFGISFAPHEFELYIDER